MYAGTVWDWATFVGTLGLFLVLFFLFIRLLPMIPMFEVRELLQKTAAKGRDQHEETATAAVRAPG